MCCNSRNFPEIERLVGEEELEIGKSYISLLI